MELLNEAYDIFWSEGFWLPPNVTWADLSARKDIHVAKPKELWFAFPLAIVLFLARLVWERVIALPLGRYFQIKETAPKKADDNDVMEKAFKKHGRILPDHNQVVGLAKQADLTTRQVERWWRRRRVQDKPSEMQRWKETTWRFTFYVAAFYYGVIVLWNKPWSWDTKHCWYGYPHQHVSDDIWWYYMIELGFYWSLVLSLFMDNKRKDFTEMIIHHVATITLLTFSWANNMVRIGTIVLVVHDAVDYWMEGAKLAKYAKFHKLCNILFVIFAVVWFITRIVIFPLRVIYATTVEMCVTLDYCYSGSYYYLNSFMIILQILHIIWFRMILKMCFAFLIDGKVEKDERSETEAETTEEETEHDKGHMGDNGSIPSSNSNNNVKDSLKATENGGTSQRNSSRIPTRRTVQREH